MIIPKRYSLVLQFSSIKLNDFDKMLDLEDALASYLHGVAEVDGHDSGSGEINIFILTNEPVETWNKAKFIINAAGLLTDISVAYRSVDGDEYTRLWPENVAEPFIIS